MLRLRRKKGLGDVLVAGNRTVATVRDGRIVSWSPYATADVRAAVESIYAARGGTLTGWGHPVVPRRAPRILRPGRDGDLWDLLREDLARDPAPRSGLEAVTGLYADGTPYV